ncbi:MAG: PLP-dependent aminotransferase family protein [Clostridiales bacterium]|nr:PLP-dependent aminotransferase family protein [Clostridiales bacterium]
MSIKYAERMDNLKASEIRELLKLTERPEVISFAGGLPAPELFPIEELKKISVKVLEEMGEEALQYSATEGYKPLRKQIAERMKIFEIETTEDEILITSGSQQGLDFCGKVFFNPDDVVIVESPSYLGAINAFKAYQCKFVEAPTDDDGMIMSELEKILETTENVKFIYVIPDFQNPTGKTWPVDRRKEFMKIANKFDVIVVEDNPYGELRFEGEIPPSLKSFDDDGRVIFLGTFSKTFTPGLRIGWVNARPDILEKFILVKQSADLQTNSMTQRELSLFMDMYDFDGHIEKIKDAYRKRRDIMIKTMEETFPENVKWTHPQGGLFTWVEFPEYINARDLMAEAIKKNVACVPGGSFFPNGGHENSMRVNYSNMTEDRIVEGVKRLAVVIKEALK